jgi:CheY-like chemotaxis protein
VHQLQQAAPRLALLDLHMPGMDRVDGLRRLRLMFPGVPMAVDSSSTELNERAFRFQQGNLCHLGSGIESGRLTDSRVREP